LEKDEQKVNENFSYKVARTHHKINNETKKKEVKNKSKLRD
jgi:hypothetical protein